jgi:tetratricopeptide (TPR) repeat protein
MAKRSKKIRRATDGLRVPGTSPQEPAPLFQDWLWGLILFSAVVLIYQPVWHAGYVWDDTMDLTENPSIIGPLGLKEIWTTSAAQFYPLTLTTFWLEHALWGLDPVPYHIVNVLFHGVCAIVLWRVLNILRVPGAWMGAALWALHPVEVESVAWISELKNTESGLFFLLSVLFFVKNLKSEGPGEKRRRTFHYGLAILFAGLAMASKSSTVILPIILVLCGWWVEGRCRRQTLAKVIPILLMAVGSAALAVKTVALQGVAADTQWAQTVAEKLITAGNAIWFYLGKLAWPHPLLAIYPRWEITAGNTLSYLPALAAVLLLVVLGWKRNSGTRPYFFAYAYFLAALLPVLGFINHFILRYSFVFDHFQYLASMGPLALLGAGLVRLRSHIRPEKEWLRVVVYLVPLLALGLLSWQRAEVYESGETLWADTVAQNPNAWVAQYNLGVAFYDKGRNEDAIVQFQKALELHPDYDDAHYSFGNALLQKGDLDGALAQYRRAVAINPNYVRAQNNIGYVLLQKGQLDEAIAQYRKAVAVNPGYALSHNDLASALLQKDQVDEALSQYRRAIELDPNSAAFYNGLGRALLRKGDTMGAIAEFQKALSLNPHFSNAQGNLLKAESMVQPAVGPR